MTTLTTRTLVRATIVACCLPLTLSAMHEHNTHIPSFKETLFAVTSINMITVQTNNTTKQHVKKNRIEDKAYKNPHAPKNLLLKKQPESDTQQKTLSKTAESSTEKSITNLIGSSKKNPAYSMLTHGTATKKKTVLAIAQISEKKSKKKNKRNLQSVISDALQDYNDFTNDNTSYDLDHDDND